MEGNFKNKRDERLQVDVKIDSGMTTSSCFIILEALLKYVLYQRYQIPMSYEMLLKTIAQIEDKEAQTLPEFRPEHDHQSKSVSDLKAEVSRKKGERKRKLWLLKAKKFVDELRKVTKILREQLESEDISVVSFVLGVSINSGQELYSVILPPDMRKIQNSHSSERHIAVQLFRAFSSHEKVLKLMDRPSGAKKMWVLFQKGPRVLPQSNNWFSSTSSASSTTGDANSMVLPVPHFQPSHRTRVVHVSFHTPQVEPSMDLTPSVGKGLIDHYGLQTPFIKAEPKRSLVFSTPMSSKRLSSECDNYAHLHCKCSSSVQQSESNDELFHNVCTSCGLRKKRRSAHGNYESLVNSLPGSPNTPRVRAFPEPILETPVVSSRNYFNSQCSPSRLLTSRISKFRLSETDVLNIYNMDDKVWYLIDQSITGFKNTLVKKYQN